MFRINVHLALASLRSSKVRTLLTIVAVIIGVFSYVVVTSTIDGLRGSVVSEINGLGANFVSVISGNIVDEDEEGNRTYDYTRLDPSQRTLTTDDLADIQAIPEVASASQFWTISGTVGRGGEQVADATIVATNQDYPSTYNVELTDGSFFKDESSLKSAVIGQGIVRDLFGGEVAPGARIFVKGESFSISGVMAEVDSTLGETFSDQDPNNYVFISSSIAANIDEQTERFNQVGVQIQDDQNPADVIQNIENVLAENRSDKPNFTVLSQDQQVELVDSLLGIVKLAGQALSFVMLFVASVVILLIMLITVRERTREIGIRKSIGATNGNILLQFLTEAIILSWVGSAIGVGLGYAAGFGVEQFVNIKPLYSQNTIISLVAISTGVGVVAGVVPAWLAARRDPVESLRHE